MEYQVFPNILCLLHCVPLYVCRLCINFQDLCARLLGMAALRILLLTFTSRFVMESLRTFVFVESVLRRGRMFQGSDGV